MKIKTTDSQKIEATGNGRLAGNDVTRRKVLAGASAMAAGLTATSLFPHAAQAAPKSGGRLRIGRAEGGTTDSLDPGTYANGFTIGMAFAYQGYLTEVGADSTVQPSLAKNWEPSTDATVWTFKLRKGVAFHSGKKLTAVDVVASINYHRGENSTSAAAPIVAQIADIRAKGTDAVVFALKGGNADSPFTLSDYHLPILPSSDGVADWNSGDGCGAYRIRSFEPGVRAELTRYGDHWTNDLGFFDAIEILALTDTNARMTALMTEEVDVIERVDLKLAKLLKKRAGLEVHSVSGNQHFTFPMSCNKAPFTDVNVRRALKHAIAREILVEKILQGYGYVGNDHPIGRGQRFFNNDLPQTPYDPDKAAWYLKQAGRDVLLVDLSVSEASFAGAVDAAVLFKEAAKPAGIDINVVRKPVDGYWEGVWMKEPFTASNWAGRTVEDAMFTLAYKSGASWNESFWSNERFDELLLAARSELDTDKRRDMYYEMQAILNQDGGAIVPMFASFVFGTSDKIGYPKTFASNLDLDGERWAERWWFK